MSAAEEIVQFLRIREQPLHEYPLARLYGWVPPVQDVCVERAGLVPGQSWRLPPRRGVVQRLVRVLCLKLPKPVRAPRRTRAVLTPEQEVQFLRDWEATRVMFPRSPERVARVNALSERTGVSRSNLYTLYDKLRAKVEGGTT